jgi:hypothetical protein
MVNRRKANYLYHNIRLAGDFFQVEQLLANYRIAPEGAVQHALVYHAPEQRAAILLEDFLSIDSLAHKLI